MLTRVSWAQGYPTRPVRIIVATAAGGTTDLAARLIAQWLTDKLGQPFTVENRTGGSNNIGTEAAARAAPDGTTLFMANSVNAINTSLFSNLTFNFSTDLIPVAVAMRSVLVLQVHPSVPAKTLPEFIAYAKANPGKINMGSGGKGSTGAMCGELFQMMAGVKFQHVPYRGESLAMADLIGGQVQMVVATVGSSIQYIKAGQVRALAVTSETRTDALPDVPPIAEALPGYEATSWSGLMAPKGTPPDDRRQAQPRRQRGPRRSQGDRALHRHRRTADARHARRVRPHHRGRHREVGEGDQATGTKAD